MGLSAFALPIAARGLQDQSQATETVVPGNIPDASGKTTQENGCGHPFCTAKAGAQESVLVNGLHE
jgi:hypothetical protein